MADGGPSLSTFSASTKAKGKLKDVIAGVLEDDGDHPKTHPKADQGKTVSKQAQVLRKECEIMMDYADSDLSALNRNWPVFLTLVS